MQSKYCLFCYDRILQKTSISFDVSAWELFWAFISGSMLVIDGNFNKDVINMTKYAKYNVTTIQFVPSALIAFLEQNQEIKESTFRTVLTIGEGLPYSTALKFIELF